MSSTLPEPADARRAEHTCHWPGCVAEVDPARWGCVKHWFTLPKELRDRVWAAYRPGQEVTKTPSKEYLAVASEVHRWAVDHAASKLQAGTPKAGPEPEPRQQMGLDF